MWVITLSVKIWIISSCLVWFGVIFIRNGLYQDGVFKFTVYIPDNYPDGDCPVSSRQLFWFRFRVWSFKTVAGSPNLETPSTVLLLFWCTFICFVLEISIWHPGVPSSCWPCVRRAWCEKSFHQMEVQTDGWGVCGTNEFYMIWISAAHLTSLNLIFSFTR